VQEVFTEGIILVLLRLVEGLHLAGMHRDAVLGSNALGIMPLISGNVTILTPVINDEKKVCVLALVVAHCVARRSKRMEPSILAIHVDQYMATLSPLSSTRCGLSHTKGAE